MVKKYRIFIICLFLFLIICLFFGKQIFTKATFGYSFIGGDNVYALSSLFQSIHRGSISFWNPYIGFGIPLFALTYINSLYPLHLLYYAISYENVIVILTVIHMLIGGFFFYLFAKKIKIREVNAVIASIIYMVSGFNIIFILMHHNYTHTTIAYIPALFLAIYCVLEKPSLLRGVVLSLIISVQISAGDINYFIITVIGLFLFVLFYCFKKHKDTKNWKEINYAVFIIIVFIVLGVLSNAVIFLPFKELLENSIRNNGFSDEYRHNFESFRLIDVMFFSIIPNYENRYASYPGAFSPFNLFYLGLMPFSLYFLAFFSKNRFKYFFCLILPLVSLIFVCGSYTPIFDLIKYLPVLKNMRLFLRFYVLFVFSIAICSGLGLNYLQENVFKYKYRKRLVVKFFLILNVLSLIVYFKDKYQNICNIDFLGILEKWRFFHLWILSLIVVSVFSILFLQYRNRKKGVMCFRQITVGLLLIIIWISYEFWLSSNGIFSYILNPETLFVMPKLWIYYCIGSFFIMSICFIKDTSFNSFRLVVFIIILSGFLIFYHSGKSVESDIDLENKTYAEFFSKKNINRIIILNPINPHERSLSSDMGTFYQTPTLGGRFGLPIDRYIKFINIMNENIFKLKDEKISYWDFSYPIETTDFINRDNIHLINMSNIKYLVVEGLVPQITLSDKSYNSPFSLIVDKDIKIYENKDALERAYIVHNVKVVKDEQLIFKVLKNPKFDYKKYAIIEEYNLPRGFAKNFYFDNNGIRVIELTKDNDARDNGLLENEYVKITEQNMNFLSMNVNMSKDGLLVLSDTYYPGWKVFIDGTETKIYRANYLFRGVFLDKGWHQVRWEYTPLFLRLGLTITIISLIVLMVIFVYGFSCFKKKSKF